MSIVVTAPRSSVRLIAAHSQQLSIVFFGTPDFAVPAFRALINAGWSIRAVVTAPDKPIGRKHVMTPSRIHAASTELGVETYTPRGLRDDAFWPIFESLRPDLCIVVAYGKIIPQRYLDAARLGFINIHPSLLPAYRGPSPVASAILDGCANTGVSLMLLDAEMDHGPVIAQEQWTIPSGFDTLACESELSRIGAELLIRTLPTFIDGTIAPQSQDHSAATFTKKFERADGCIDWTQSAVAIYNRVRALSKNPGTWTKWNGRTLNIIDVHTVHAPIASGPPGTVERAGEDVIVYCGTGAICLEELQLEGATRQDVRAFINGHPSIIGAILAA